MINKLILVHLYIVLVYSHVTCMTCDIVTLCLLYLGLQYAMVYDMTLGRLIPRLHVPVLYVFEHCLV